MGLGGSRILLAHCLLQHLPVPVLLLLLLLLLLPLCLLLLLLLLVQCLLASPQLEGAMNAPSSPPSPSRRDLLAKLRLDRLAHRRHHYPHSLWPGLCRRWYTRPPHRRCPPGLALESFCIAAIYCVILHSLVDFKFNTLQSNANLLRRLTCVPAGR